MGDAFTHTNDFRSLFSLTPNERISECVLYVVGDDQDKLDGIVRDTTSSVLLGNGWHCFQSEENILKIGSRSNLTREQIQYIKSRDPIQTTTENQSLSTLI